MMSQQKLSIGDYLIPSWVSLKELTVVAGLMVRVIAIKKELKVTHCASGATFRRKNRNTLKYIKVPKLKAELLLKK